MREPIPEWQSALAATGRVEFRPNVSLLVLFVAAGSAVAAWAIHHLATAGASPAALLWLALAVVGIPVAIRAHRKGPWLVVSTEGIRTLDEPLLPFERIVEVRTLGPSVIFLHPDTARM